MQACFESMQDDAEKRALILVARILHESADGGVVADSYVEALTRSRLGPGFGYQEVLVHAGIRRTDSQGGFSQEPWIKFTPYQHVLTMQDLWESWGERGIGMRFWDREQQCLVLWRTRLGDEERPEQGCTLRGFQEISGLAKMLSLMQPQLGYTCPVTGVDLSPHVNLLRGRVDGFLDEQRRVVQETRANARRQLRKLLESA